MHLLVGEHIGSLHFLAIVNSSDMNIDMQISASNYPGYTPKSGIARACGNSRYNFFFEELPYCSPQS